MRRTCGERVAHSDTMASCDEMVARAAGNAAARRAAAPSAATEMTLPWLGIAASRMTLLCSAASTRASSRGVAGATYARLSSTATRNPAHMHGLHAFGSTHPWSSDSRSNILMCGGCGGSACGVPRAGSYETLVSSPVLGNH